MTVTELPGGTEIIIRVVDLDPEPRDENEGYTYRTSVPGDERVLSVRKETGGMYRIVTVKETKVDDRLLELARLSHDADVHDACVISESHDIEGCSACKAGVAWRRAYTRVLDGG